MTIVEEKIKELLDEILVLGSMVEQAILDAVDALKNKDVQIAKQVYASDKEVNKRRYDIENQAVTVLATQQPMAKDMRTLASILDVAGELERIGDYAKGIAHITTQVGTEPFVKPLIDIPEMAKLTSNMLHRALGAFVSADKKLALSIPTEDDQVDDLYNQVYRELLTYMMNDPSTIDQSTYLLWVAHNLERSADRVSNICERTYYIATGELREISASDDETQT